MYVLGHVGISLLLYAPIAAWLLASNQPTLAVLTGLVMVALAPLPDVDTCTDRVEHRGPTHTIWFAFGVGLMVAFGSGLAVDLLSAFGVIDLVSPVSAAVWFGSIATLTLCGHLAGDLITPMGIWPFRPFSTYHWTLDLTPSKNPRANRLWFGAGVVVLVATLLVVVS